MPKFREASFGEGEFPFVEESGEGIRFEREDMQKMLGSGLMAHDCGYLDARELLELLFPKAEFEEV